MRRTDRKEIISEPGHYMAGNMLLKPIRFNPGEAMTKEKFWTSCQEIKNNIMQKYKKGQPIQVYALASNPNNDASAQAAEEWFKTQVSFPTQ
jgi:hypothetical protein